MTDDKPIVVGHVESSEGDPDDPPMTLAEFLKWREEEDRRMIDQAVAELRAHLERMFREVGGGSVH